MSLCKALGLTHDQKEKGEATETKAAFEPWHLPAAQDNSEKKKSGVSSKNFSVLSTFLSTVDLPT